MGSERLKPEAGPFDLGGFRVDPSRRVISGPDDDLTIEPKIMAVLQMLAAHVGEVVTRQQFIDSIWATEYGGDESLTRAVSHLRKIFGDRNDGEPYIETVPKTGYRLVCREDSSMTPRKRRRSPGPVVLALVGLAVIISVVAFYRFDSSREEEPKIPPASASIMLAVLPFDIQGGTSEDEPLAFSVADEILSALSQNPSIAVIAGNSSFQFQGERKKDLAALGRQLNVNYVIDGSLRRSPQGLRVGVHLIDAKSELVEWSEVVTRPEDEIYTIPNEVAAAVQIALGTEPVERRKRRTAPDPAAYEGYLYAKYLLRQPWGGNLDTAIEELERSVTLDPSLSEAWSTLAITRVEQGFGEGPNKPDPESTIWSERLRAARQDAETALAIDPESVEAALALILIDYRKQVASLAETDDRLRSLLARAPNHPKLNLRMGMFLGAVGQFEAAVRYLGRALALDPLTVMNAALYADQLLCSGRMDDALTFIRAAGVYERYQRTYTGLVTNLLAENYEMARDSFTILGPNDVFIVDGVVEIPSIKVESPNTKRLGDLMARLIDVTEKEDSSLDVSLNSDLIEAADEGLILHFYVAQLLAVARFQDAATELVMQRIAKGDNLVRESGILLRPAFWQARRDPRIMELFNQTGHAQYWLETNHWPDYCEAPDLPYDCESLAKSLPAL
jgi:TolB-like protein/DNA-binding winged helix-turn-helix (wHTH) protein/Flp pilus assembly protein TadD